MIGEECQRSSDDRTRLHMPRDTRFQHPRHIPSIYIIVRSEHLQPRPSSRATAVSHCTCCSRHYNTTAGQRKISHCNCHVSNHIGYQQMPRNVSACTVANILNIRTRIDTNQERKPRKTCAPLIGTRTLACTKQALLAGTGK